MVQALGLGPAVEGASGSTSTSAPVGQEIVSVAAWLFLAFVVFRALERRAVKYVGFSLVLAFSLVPAIAVWDGALLSESLSVSLGALLVGTMLLFAQFPSWPRAAAVLVVAFLLAGTRSTNGYLTPFLLIPLAAAAAGRARWPAVAVAVCSLAIAGFTHASVNVRQWQVSLGEITAGRILHSPSETSYFTAHGMPYRPSLEQQLWNAEHRPPVTSYVERYETDPTLTWFFPWFNAHFRSVYAGYLLSHPGPALVDPIRDLPSLVSASSSTDDLQGLPLGIYEAQGYRDPLPSWLARASIRPVGGSCSRGALSCSCSFSASPSTGSPAVSGSSRRSCLSRRYRTPRLSGTVAPPASGDMHYCSRSTCVLD